MSLHFTPKAETDLEGIGDYIAQDEPARALAFVTELREQCGEIAQRPQAYRARPELGDGLRSCARGHYIIFFQVRDRDVLIVRILRD